MAALKLEPEIINYNNSDVTGPLRPHCIINNGLNINKSVHLNIYIHPHVDQRSLNNDQLPTNNHFSAGSGYMPFEEAMIGSVENPRIIESGQIQPRKS